MITWDSELYLRYELERTQPSIDLATRIPLEAPKEIIDLGCGPGNSTRVLWQRWPNARIVGLDSSPLVIERARSGPADIEWRVADIQSWSEPGRFDLIFANASLHWIPGHETFVCRLMDQLKPGKVLAFQMPALYDQPASRTVSELARSPRWRSYCLHERYTLRVHKPAEYYDWLAPLSRHLQIWETVYFQMLESHQGIIEFYASTGLQPYLEGLPSEELRHQFKTDLLERYRTLFPCQGNGNVLLPVRRLFVIAVRSGAYFNIAS